MLHIAKRSLLRLLHGNVRSNGSMIHLAQCMPTIFKYSTRDEEYDTQTGDEDSAESKEHEMVDKAEPEERAENEREDTSRQFPLLGGGLEKIQGGIREEQFFNDRTKEMIKKIREDGRKNKDDFLSDEYWNEYKKTLETSDHRTSSSLSKHKNVLEEMYFLSEQLDTLRLYAERMRNLANQIEERQENQEENLDLDTLLSSDGIVEVVETENIEQINPAPDDTK